MPLVRLVLVPLLLPLFVLHSAGAQDRTHFQNPPYSGELVSLDVQDASIRSVIATLSQVARKNIVLHPEVQGTVTMRVREIPWDQALELVLRTKGLYQFESGNVILVVPVEKVRQVLQSG